jgi:flagellin
MGLTIGTNTAAISVNRHLQRSGDAQNRSYQRLASGERIVSAADDPAGLSIAENLHTQIRSMTQAERNANDGVSFVQVAEGGLNEISNIMVRLRELGIQAASDTIGDRERGYINEEAALLIQEVDRIANVTNFNGTSLLNGDSPHGALQFQVGINGSVDDRITFDPTALDARTSTLGIDDLNYENIDNARDTLATIDRATGKIFSSRSILGATQNRLESTVRALETNKEDLSYAHSRIADTDVAVESAELARGNILQATGIAMLSQANSIPAQALKLL